MMAGIAVRAAGASLTDRDDSSLSPVGRTARTPRKASPSLLHDSAHCTASTIHAKTPISSSSDQGTINSSSMSTPTGTKLAVTTTYDSSAGGEEDIRQDLFEAESLAHIIKSDKDIQRAKPPTPIQLVTEKEIALSQLQELEVAIKVRKGSKVDGRKVRWIEYRARKAEEEKNNNSSSKPKTKSRKSKSVENDENALSVNNNNNSENTENMKGEVTNTPLVLESMKLQFLQGTENIEGSVTNGSNSDGGLHKSPDATQKRKSGRTRRSQSTPKENKEIKRSPKNASKNSQKTKSKGSAVGDEETEVKSISSLKKIPPKEATLNGTSEILTKIENVPTEDVPSITTPAIVPSFKVKSPATSPGLSEILPSCVRPVYKSVTKGLREVRKTENGVEVETVKNDNGVLTSSSGTENKLENDFKCMTVTPPPAYWNPPPRARSADSVPLNKKKSVSPKKVKTALSKSVERIDSEIESITNGHHDIEIDSQKEDGIEKDNSHLSSEENVDTPNKTSPTNNEEDNVKRRRGRPPKRKLNLVEVEDPKVSPHGKSSKKIETVIADVHNTMNGEPQTVIPVSRPVLRGKKVSVVKRLVKRSQGDILPDTDSSDIVPAKTSVKKGTSSENASKGKDKSSRLDAKKKMTSTKKGSAGVPLDNSEINSTASASLNNQIQTTTKSKSTKSVKGVRLGLSSPGKSDAKNTPIKASPQSEEEADVSDSEQKGKYLGKGEKSLAGRVIRRSEPGKSQEHTKQPLNKSPSTKDEIASSRESLTPKTSSTTKSASQKSSNTLRSSSSRSISLENISAVKEDTKTVDDDGVHKVKPKYNKVGEGTNLRKSSSFITENSDGQIGSVEESPKRSQKPGSTIPVTSRSKNSLGNSILPNKGKPVDTASEDSQANEELPTLGDSEDKELHGLQKTMKGKGKAKNKEGSVNIQRDLVAEDKTLTPRRATKKNTVMESSKVRPKKSLDNKKPQGVEEAPEATTEVTPLDKVSDNSKVCVDTNTEKAFELDKGRQASVRQGKSQKELSMSATKKMQKDESAEIIMSREVTNVLPSEEPKIEPKMSEQPNIDKAQEVEETLEDEVSENVQVPDSSKLEMLASNCKVQSSKAQLIKKRKISNEKPSIETVSEVNISTNVTVEESSASCMSLKAEDQVIENLEEDKLVSNSEGVENTEHLNEEQSKEKENLVEEKILESNSVGDSLPHNLKQILNETEQLEIDCKSEIKIEEISPIKSIAPAEVSSSSGITSINTKSPVLSPQYQDKVAIQPEETTEVEMEELSFNKSPVIEKNDDLEKNHDLIESKQSLEPDLKIMDNQIEFDKDTSKSVENSSVGNIEKGEGEKITEGNLENNQSTAIDELNVSVCSCENSVDTGTEIKQKTSGPELSTKVFYAKNKNKTSLLPLSTSENLSEVSGIKVDIGEGIAEVIQVDSPKSIESQNEKTEVNVTEQVCETQSPLFGKSKEKVPRILKQLFQDEGVQNMLKSMSDESVAVSEGSSSESSVHKLRPKRPTEPMLASSPELDGVVDALFPNTKKRKRWSELDTLYMDEGVLNLLTSIDSNSRRAGQDDAASDISQASSVRSVKTNKSSKSSLDVSDTRKRKLSGASTVSNTSTKSMQPPESKKICLEQGSSTEDPYDYNPAEEMTIIKLNEENIVEPQEDLSLVSKKKGRPTLPLQVKHKNKAIRMQLKVQKHKPLGGVSSYVDQTNETTTNVEDLQEVLEKDEKVDFEEENVNLAELQDTLRKEKAGTSSKVVAQPDEYLKRIEEQQEPIKSKKSEFEEDNLNLAELQDTLRKEKATMSSKIDDPQINIEQSAKSIPPLKIKLASDSVTISHISKPTPKKTSSFIVEPPKTLHEPQSQQSHSKPHLHSSLAALSGTGVMQKSDFREQPRPSTSTASVHLMPHQKGIETLGIPGSAGLPSLVRTFDFNGQGKGRARVGETLRQSQRASVRQSEANNHYRDIAMRKFNNFTQIIMSPSTTKMKNSLNSRVLRELCEALNILKKDESVRMVLLTATGPTFCQGVDLTALQHPNLETRKKNAENLVRGIKEFLRTLVQFPKPIVAGVNGNAMGLGVTMLPLFDLVIVNDKAEFYLPYAKLGQIPEGGATYTFPNLFGKLKSMQLFLGHKVTASMALEMGLASESIWPATYQQELIPKVALLATQSAQSMEATKALMNHHLITKLELSLESECRLLLQHWTSPHFALLCKRFLDSHHIHLQKPVNLPL